ncbi:MAG: menaquinone biosynthesis decarboxylase [Clostridiales bacterium]|nr:menaquinone biosynthesis decarboxylase [Clostridiales bacterium]
MAYKDLRAFLAALEGAGQLHRIDAAVDSYLEIAEITDRVSKRLGPALLFTRVKGSAFPVLTNAFGSYRRMELALETDSLDAPGEKIRRLLGAENYLTLVDKLKALPRLAGLAACLPVPAARGAWQEIEAAPDLTQLPALQCWPEDGGRYLTLPVVCTMDPETGAQNYGVYRMQVFGRRTAGMHWHLHKDGRSIYEKYKKLGGRMPVSVAVGCDPAVTYAATAPLPPGVDEMLLAGFLRGRPVSMTKSVLSDVRVPANCEFLLEGYVDLDELREEGPFGDHTGYYSEKAPYPVFHLKRLFHRADPIYQATLVGRPPMEDCYMAKATERIFLPFLQAVCPDIRDMDLPIEGVFHNCAVVSIRKRYPGQAAKVMHALWGLGQMMYQKLIVVVDEDVDPHNRSEVLWRVFNNIDPSRDLLITPGPLDALDHASPTRHFGSRMGVDATRKLPEEGHPRPWPADLSRPAELQRLVRERWGEYGFQSGGPVVRKVRPNR